MAIEHNRGIQLQRMEMTPVMENAEQAMTPETEEGDIPVTDIGLDGVPGGGTSFGMAPAYPIVFPESPTFNVPSNPLLPEEYREVLDYNAIQYMNGFFRTQIGRYVRVEQLTGSNIIEDYDGFLIGVGINYIILQDYSSSNIRGLDIYGIKNMYVYYADLTNPYSVTRENQ